MREKLIYLAGPLYTPAERHYLEKISQEIEKLGFKTFVPHRDAGLCPAGEENTEYYFTKDLEYIDKASIIVAVLNGCDVDSGTSFEIGYAYARHRLIIGLIEDTRISNISTQINLMIYNSCNKIFDNLKDMLNYVISLKEMEDDANET